MAAELAIGKEVEEGKKEKKKEEGKKSPGKPKFIVEHQNQIDSKHKLASAAG